VGGEVANNRKLWAEISGLMGYEPDFWQTGKHLSAVVNMSVLEGIRIDAGKLKNKCPAETSRAHFFHFSAKSLFDVDRNNFRQVKHRYLVLLEYRP
jgi:hypothetical protein